MAKPRILHLHNIVSPYRIAVFDEVSRDFELDVLFGQFRTKDRKWTPDLASAKFDHKILGHLNIGPFLLNPGIIPWLLKNKYDAYLIGDYPEMLLTNWVVIRFAKIRRKPVVLWSETLNHDVIYYPHLITSDGFLNKLTLKTLNWLSRSYRRALIKKADHYLALSNLARDFLIIEGIPKDRIDTGPQVMPKQLLADPSLDVTNSPYRDKKLVLYLGYLNHLKGVDRLINVFKSIPGDDVRLGIVGSGPEDNHLRHLAGGDSRIKFYGYVEGVGRANLMSWAQIFVLPTLADCWGLVVNESLYYGVPVITTNVAGASELLSDGAGIVLPPRDDAALKTALEKVLSDHEYVSQLQRRASRKAAQVTDPKVGAEPILQALKHALERQ